MPLKLNKNLFTRDRHRDREVGDIFSKIANSITTIMPFIVVLFFTPVILVTASFFTKDLIFIFADICLSLGYVSNFAYRIYKREVSKSELLTTLLFIGLALTLAYFLAPTIAVVSLVSVISVLNQFAAAVNLFFILKHILVPPFKQTIEKIVQYCGLDITGSYYSKRHLELEADRFVIDRLVLSTYKHDSFAPEFNKTEINHFNKLLDKLCQYINKYDESVFGYLVNKDAIADLESHIAQLTTQGSPDSAYAFIHKKLSFKTTKLKLLREARGCVLEALANPEADTHHALSFFYMSNNKQFSENNCKELLQEGLGCIQAEIKRQQSKISSLEACLPHPQP
jgi:hypothetical protein